jgi:hypothetical protein
MGYTTDDSCVRVDFFKPSGKWYTTESVTWTGPYEGDIIFSFAKSLLDHLKFRETDRKHQHPSHVNVRLSGLTAVCLDPYHQHSFPLMLEVDRVESIVQAKR